MFCRIFVALTVLVCSTTFSLATNQPRLVVGGGSLTEIIYALGAQDLIVGRDASSTFPAHTQTIPDVGYYRTLNVEGLLSVKPTHLILLEGAGPSSVVEQVDSLGIKVTTIKNTKTVKGLLSSIETIAEIVNKPEKGQALVKDIVQQIDAVKNKSTSDVSKAVFLMSAGERGLMAAGKNTTPQLIFDLLNIDNPYIELEGFKTISAESLAANPPSIIFIASHTTRGTDVVDLCASNQLRLWAETQGCNLIKVDSLKYLGLTPRLPEALKETLDKISM